ncbi:uncharacterized protein An05g01580 [Aspergillus niger]|uniref:Contig An05c0050, genomic contig n=2 Tax=Aspergillus niger TaxID=5061 RepID=A2QKV8_ASPNC|nr:uncharacterized protein An05g01580 [Aspergillus niger]CAK96495.1 unnamed protein product [Aspergillus niger]
MAAADLEYRNKTWSAEGSKPNVSDARLAGPDSAPLLTEIPATFRQYSKSSQGGVLLSLNRSVYPGTSLRFDSATDCKLWRQERGHGSSDIPHSAYTNGVGLQSELGGPRVILVLPGCGCSTQTVKAPKMGMAAEGNLKHNDTIHMVTASRTSTCLFNSQPMMGMMWSP